MTRLETAVCWVLSGRVQGVGFRWYALRIAERLQVSGWVRNLRDGGVEVAARGSPETLATFEAALRAGPGLATVENVEKRDISLEEIDPKSFHIR